jgi:2-polyprenyl-6-methoxyphenol hydroxylase-like FAD-dependent oxidoreductase
MNVLISGAGIAGPTLAYWLLHYGFQPTLVEHAPHLRTGGYIVDFWGAGYDVADRMGLLPELHRVGYQTDNVLMVDARGRQTGGFSVDIFRTATQNRFISLARGDLATAIFHTIEDRVPVLFADHIVAIEPDASGVTVNFAHAPQERFDLVIGADGLHSGVRRLIFGDEAQFEKYLGYDVATFALPGYRPRDEDAYVTYSEPGMHVGRFALHDDRTMIVLIWAADRTQDPDLTGSEQHKAILHDRFDDAGWECPQIMAALDSVDDLYYDHVSQIRMDAWSRGRVALVGDAAFCVSLLAGEGSSLAMAAAYVLAGELARANGQYQEAFARYEEILRPHIVEKQRTAQRLAKSFVPRTALGIWLRSLISRAFVIPGVADRFLVKSVTDGFVLPNYRESPAS